MEQVQRPDVDGAAREIDAGRGRGGDVHWEGIIEPRPRIIVVAG
jgi:hypothetical protein